MRSLYELIQDYSLERGITGATTDQIVYAVRRLKRHIGCTPTTGHLTRDVLNNWLKALAESGEYSPRTIAGTRAALIGLWHFAHEIGEVPDAPARVRPVRVPEPLPRGWTREELARILAAARGLPRERYLPNGVQLCLYFPTLIEIAYYSGLPRGDIMDLTQGQFEVVGEVARILKVRNKTAGRLICQVPRSTYVQFCQILYRIRRDGHENHEHPLRWPMSWRMLYTWFRRLLSTAGVDSEGALHQLRRSGATHVLKRGGDPTCYLNHKDPRVARKFYIDALQLDDAVMPAELPDSNSSERIQGLGA